jgi:signal transduction histidine kinase
MERQVDHLIRLVDDLLDVSRLSRGAITLKNERLSLGDLVMQVVESRSALSPTEECRIRVNFRESPLFIRADPVRLTQILSNLLDNAKKYSPATEDIDITLERQGEHAVISVKDNGYGIPADMLPRIFDVFVQVDQNQSQARGGLGIGLALVRSLVELHGGTVEAHSGGKDKGSEFVVRLPLSSS